MRKTLMTKADTKLLIAIILLSIVAYAIIRYSSVPFTVEGRVIIKTGGEVVQELPLSADTSAQRISIQGRTDPAVIEIEKGGSCGRNFCPIRCVLNKAGIDTPGINICIPNKLVIIVCRNGRRFSGS